MADQAVQAGHAVAKYILESMPIRDKIPHFWENETLVYLTVEDLQYFDMLHRRLHAEFYRFVVWWEPDLEEATALACDTKCPWFDQLRMLGT